METCTLLPVGLKEAAVAHHVIGRAGTLDLYLELRPYLFAALDTCHTLPRPWEDSMSDFCSIQLQMA